MPTYWEYLKLDELLELQQRLGKEHDEMLFIVIHQSYELWFKEMLHEIDYMQTLMNQTDLPRVSHTFKRVLTILKMMVAKIDILETMTPLEFIAFRERLESGSGFQSAQFRELEFVLGYKRRTSVDHYANGSAARARLEKRFAAPTLWDSFAHFLAAADYAVPAEVLTRDVTQPIAANAGMQKALMDVYRSNPSLASLCERMVDLDEGVQEWRYRHVKMVERTIGTKMGTGGSTGADYLKTTLMHPLFPDLWEIRTSF
ncbi:MAG TPA: tryptophan 2,3-dioxygenase family protein [Candidatus Krumholzibacteria bacterium]|nr:tryptophan 2,3-dioxygenase family protein [Candidatus Krumholzibacteria bacterium]